MPEPGKRLEPSRPRPTSSTCWPSGSEVAGYLLLRHNSAAELVNRAEAAGLVRRKADPDDARIARVRLTRKGDRLVSELTQAHIAELHHLAAVLNEIVPTELSA